MGICESTPNTQNKTGVIQGIVQNKQYEHTENHSVNMPKTNLRHVECEVDPLKPYTEFDHDTSKELSKEICKIIIETKEGKIKGTGFFLRFPIDLEWFSCLLTNDHIINNESINNNNIIYTYYEEFKAANIVLDRNKRYIKSFKDEKLDITVVEILDEDNMYKNIF